MSSELHSIFFIYIYYKKTVDTQTEEEKKHFLDLYFV